MANGELILPDKKIPKMVIETENISYAKGRKEKIFSVSTFLLQKSGLKKKSMTVLHNLILNIQFFRHL